MFHVKHFLSKNASPISFHMSRAAEASPKTLPVLSPFDSSPRKDPTGDNPSHKVSHVILVPVKAPAAREEELRAAHGERLACYAGFRMRSHMCPDVSRGTSGHIHSFIEKSSGRSCFIPQNVSRGTFPS